MKSQMGDASPSEAGEVRFGEAGELGSGNQPLGPDFTASLWTSWVEWAAQQATSMGASAANRNWWQVLLDRIASDPLQGGGLIPGYILAVRELFPAEEASWRIPTVMFPGALGMAAGGWLAGVMYDELASTHRRLPQGLASAC
jgi:hypothetical protein